MRRGFHVCRCAGGAVEPLQLRCTDVEAARQIQKPEHRHVLADKRVDGMERDCHEVGEAQAFKVQQVCHVREPCVSELHAMRHMKVLQGRVAMRRGDHLDSIVSDWAVADVESVDS